MLNYNLSLKRMTERMHQIWFILESKKNLIKNGVAKTN